MNDKSKIALALLTGPTYTKLEQHRYFWAYLKNVLYPINIEFQFLYLLYLEETVMYKSLFVEVTKMIRICWADDKIPFICLNAEMCNLSHM